MHPFSHVRTRTPLPDESTSLRLAECVPLLAIVRVTQDGRPVALEEFLIPGDDLELTYTFGAQGARPSQRG